MPATIINAHGRHRRAALVDPAPNGYLHIAAQTDPPLDPQG
jgi:hypothetical protein